LTDLQRDLLYVDALITDLEQELPHFWGRNIQTIFIGGGTPSLIQPEALELMLSRIKALVKLSPYAEITLEANPGTVDQEKFSEFKALGINRLSMGIQSFDDDLLLRIGRIHDGSQAMRACEKAILAGFENINLDFMFALPGQSLKQAIGDLQTAFAFNPAHLSHYQLTLEPNTLFASHPPSLPDDDSSYEMQNECQQLLADAGYQHYEISAYAQAGKQSRHNLNYWQFGDYIGIGAGAHGKLSDAFKQQIVRRWKVKQPHAYMQARQKKYSTKNKKQSMIAGETKLLRHDIGFEFMLNTTRLVNGFKTRLFQQHTGLAINLIEKELKRAVNMGLIQWDLYHIKPTERGLRYLNELQTIFL
jgi:oxygen-independent coproporphyrinogen-3 oxidase